MQSLAEAYAEDGIERLAGKGWRELEKEQQLHADADIAGQPASSKAREKLATLEVQPAVPFLL